MVTLILELTDQNFQRQFPRSKVTLAEKEFVVSAYLELICDTLTARVPKTYNKVECQVDELTKGLWVEPTTPMVEVSRTRFMTPRYRLNAQPTHQLKTVLFFPDGIETAEANFDLYTRLKTELLPEIHENPYQARVSVLSSEKCWQQYSQLT